MTSQWRSIELSTPKVWLLAGVATFPIAWYCWSSASKTPVAPSTDFSSFIKRKELLQTNKAPRKRPSPPSTSFSAFLKVPATLNTAAATDFKSFLKKQSQFNAQNSKKLKKSNKSPPPPPTAARVVLLYGTEYGFSKEIAEKLQSKLPKELYWPVLMNMVDLSSGYDFSKEQAVFVVCSTQGDGVPPSESREFCDWLFADKAGSLSHLRFSVCALGDKSYPHFCRCGRLVDDALERGGAVRVVPRVDVNKEDWVSIDGWLDAVTEALPSLGLIPVGELAGGFQAAEDKAAGAPGWTKSRPYYATVTALEGLCNVSGPQDKNTLRVAFDLRDSGLTYLPGDALGMYPHNNTEAVEALLQVLGWDGSQPVPIPKWHYEEPAEQLQVDDEGCAPVREVLKRCYDVRSPKPELFELLQQRAPAVRRTKTAGRYVAGVAATNGLVTATANGNGHTMTNGVHPKTANGDNAATQNGSLAASANGVDHPMVNKPVATAAQNDGSHSIPGLDVLLSDSALREQYLEQRHVIDVLQDFGVSPMSPLPFAPLLASLRPLLPRLYSISSSPLEDATGVQATIAEVRYSCLGRQREGVCSTFVSSRLEVGQQVAVYIHKNPDFRLPPDPSTPLIMVGPGTGLAPFRSFILQRLLEHKQGGGSGNPAGAMTLFFGCRRRDQDYLYGQDLDAWSAEGVLKLFNAFSREQAGKVYVQQRLAQNSELVWEQLQAGAHFYVCGDASSMAGAVESTLLEIIESNIGRGREAAQEYLESLTRAGRYQRDVWF